MIQLVFDAGDAAAGARDGPGRGRLQPARGRRARRLGRREARARRRHAPGRLPGRRLAREQFTERSTSAAPPTQGVGCDDTRGAARRAPPRGAYDPERSCRGGARVPVDRLRGPLGRAPEGVLQRPDRPEPEDAVDRADRVVEEVARPRLRRADRRRLRHERDRLLLRRGRGGLARARAAGCDARPDAPGPRGRCSRSPSSPRPARRGGPRRRCRVARRRTLGPDPLRPPARMYVAAPVALPRHRRPVHPARRRHRGRSRRSCSAASACSGVDTTGESAGALVLLVSAIGTTLTLLGFASSRRRQPARSSSSTQGAGSARCRPTGSRSPASAAARRASASPCRVGAADATAVLVPVAIWLAVRWALLAQVVELEGRSAVGALRRSASSSAAAGSASRRSSASARSSLSPPGRCSGRS